METEEADPFHPYIIAVGLFQLKSEVPVSNYPVLDMYDVPHTPVYNSPHQVIRYQVTKSSVLLL